MPYKRYSDNERAEALIRLAVNKYDYEKTAEQCGISDRTLRRWDKVAIKKGIPELLERAIERMLMVIPSDMKGSDWAITLGILIDKWQLIRGAPTDRTETISRKMGGMSEDEFADVLSEANRILEESTSGSLAEGDGDLSI